MRITVQGLTTLPTGKFAEDIPVGTYFQGEVGPIYKGTFLRIHSAIFFLSDPQASWGLSVYVTDYRPINVVEVILKVGK